MIRPCLTLSIIKYASRVKWSNLGKGVAPSPTPWCSSYWKGSLLVALDYGRQLYFTYKWKAAIDSQPFPWHCLTLSTPQSDFDQDRIPPMPANFTVNELTYDEQYFMTPTCLPNQKRLLLLFFFFFFFF